MPPMPVQRYLVLEPSRVAPDGFTTLEKPILNGLPDRIELDDRTTLMLRMPTGQGTLWRDADPEATVSDSESQSMSLSDVTITLRSEQLSPPLRLSIAVSGRRRAVVPVAAGVSYAVAGPNGEHLELIILDWCLNAGTVRGTGRFGSRVVLAWRLMLRGTDTFSAPPIHPDLRRRLEHAQRFYSQSDIQYQGR